MIVVDANLLLYAYDSASKHHARAKSWWERRLSEQEPVGLTWVTILAFIRIITHPSLGAVYTIEEAVSIVEEWLERPMVSILPPTERHWNVLTSHLCDAQAYGNLVTDAHLATIAREYGATVHTNDRDFARFSGIKVEYPLIEPLEDAP